MPDKIEKILKQIHLMFAKGEPYKGSTTDVVVNKKEVFELLEHLNYAILEVMDAYEINELSKEQAIHRVQKDAQKIIDDASKSAEEIYAASIIYTDDALVELRDMVKKTKASLVKEYENMINKIDSQVEMINKNKDELHMQLADLSSGNEYLNIILDEKKRREKERNKYNRVENGENVDNTESRLTQYAKKARAEKGEVNIPDEFERRMSNPEVVINVNTNHPAFRNNNPDLDEDEGVIETEDKVDGIETKEITAEMETVEEKTQKPMTALELYRSKNQEKQENKSEGNVDPKSTFLGKFLK